MSSNIDLLTARLRSGLTIVLLSVAAGVVAVAPNAAAAADLAADGVPSSAAAPASAASNVSAGWVHAYAAFGEPKYPRGFTHFGYANPDAPKGGTLYLGPPDRRSSFDKYNYFTLRGNAPAGVMIFMFEPLAVRGSDEPMTMYGLIAEEMLVAPDKSSITFRIHPKAKFYNGDPVRAADVKHSFEQMSGPKAGPDWQTVLSGAGAAVVLGERTIRFDMKERTSDAIIKLATYLRVFSPKWGLGANGKPKAFDEIVSEYPITTGPYTIAATESGRRIEFKRNPDYWARDLPTQRGMYNFDRIVYRYYQDRAVGTEAFKAGEYDLVRVYGARTWNRQHKGPKWDDGRIVKKLFDTSLGQGMQSYEINLRRPIFQDIRVREAIGLTWDFETINRYKMFKRANSLFNNSEFAAAGLPSAGELKLLEPFRKDLPKEVFGPPYVAPSTASGPNALRVNLLKARGLLEAAGWKLAPDGKLRNAKGDAFEFEYLIPNDGGDADWARNLAKLGITMKEREVDFALYARRLEQYDFDVVTIVEPRFALPSPQDYVRLYSSKSADEKGNDNYRGIKNPAVDAALQAMSSATTLEALRDACRVLDRVVMWLHPHVPQLYISVLPVSYWNKFGMPERQPRFMTIESTFDLDQNIAWPLATWWTLDPTKR